MKDRIIEILDNKKVENISLIDMRMRSALFDFFIIGTISSNSQVYAILDEIKKQNIKIHHIEETNDGGWTLIDCFDVIVHLFTQQKRAEYDLESLWEVSSRSRGIENKKP